MMLKLADPTLVPPGGWRFYQPETNTEVRAGDFDRLIQAVHEHRKLHNIPIGPIFEEEVEHWLASQEGVFSAPRQMPKTLPSRRTTIDDVHRFVGTMKRWLDAGGEVVSQEEAERRAMICSGCPENVQAKGCWGCRATLNLLRKQVAGLKTSIDHSLQACAICGCEIKLAVHLPVEVQGPMVGAPGWCWKLRQEVIDPLDEPADEADTKDGTDKAYRDPDGVEQIEQTVAHSGYHGTTPVPKTT